MPMLRRLFSAFSALSLLLCVAAAVMWARSHRVGDTYLLERLHHVVTAAGASSGGGAITSSCITFESISWRTFSL
jgi:hypothetical protein